MNHATRFLLTGLLAAGALATTLHAQTPAAGDPFVKDPAAANAKKAETWRNCLVVLEIYALDKAEALAVLDAERGGAARYRRVTDLSKSGKARLETLTALTTKSGQRAVTESIDEVRYPTEFDPPNSKNGLAAPTAWETRNAGDTLELEVVVDPDGRTCDLNVIPQHVGLAGFKDVGGMANDVLISQPTFHVQKITSAVAALENEPLYLGTITPPTDRGIANGEAPSEVWLAFLHTYLPGPTAEEIKPPAKPAERATLTLEYVCYSLDRATARELLVGATTLHAPWQKMQAALKDKKARLEHVVTVNTKPGQRSVTEAVQEVRYGTEYAPESRAGSTENTRRSVSSTTNAKDSKEATTVENTTVTRTEPNAERIPGYLTAFETRNAGVTVEVEPVVVADGTAVELNQAIQSVIYHGNLKVTGVAAQYPAQPLFEAHKIMTSQTLLLGKNLLVGTLNPPGADGVNERRDSGRTWLLFVRALNEP